MGRLQEGEDEADMFVDVAVTCHKETAVEGPLTGDIRPGKLWDTSLDVKSWLCQCDGNGVIILGHID